MVVCPRRKLKTLFACGDAALARATDGHHGGMPHPWRALYVIHYMRIGGMLKWRSTPVDMVLDMYDLG